MHTPKYSFWIIFILLLTACNPNVATPAPNLDFVISTKAAQTVVAQITQTAAVQPTVTKTPVRTVRVLLPTPTFIPAQPEFRLNGYVVVFTRHGNLYFQDGNNAPIELATSAYLISYKTSISDDNQKIVFSSGDGNEYSINTNGIRKQMIVSKDWLNSFETGTTISILDFIPGTHQLLFATELCESLKSGAICSSSIFLVDADTTKIKKLADLGPSHQKNKSFGNIAVSPNGKMLAVATMERMDILDMNGKVIRHNILSYKPRTSDVLFPSLSWLPDSNELVVAIPDVGYRFIYTIPAYTIWRYAVENSAPIKVDIQPSPEGFDVYISPDGNWSVYTATGGPQGSLLYIANLTNGHTQIFGEAYASSFWWGPDSKYFIYDHRGSTLSATDGTAISLDCWGQTWVDADHFTCVTVENNVSKIRMAEIGTLGVKIYNLGFGDDVGFDLTIKKK